MQSTPRTSVSAERAGSERILVLAPTGRDAFLIVRTLEQAGLQAEACADTAQFTEIMKTDAGAGIVTGEALTCVGLERLRDTLVQQPPWSDFPLIVLTHASETFWQLLPALDGIGNVSLLERPIRTETLMSAAKAALRSRRRQYQVRDQLLMLERATRSQELLLAELSHRVKNTLATVQSIAMQSLVPGKSIEECRDIFNARLFALGHTHGLLAASEWKGAELRAIVDQAMQAFAGSSGRVAIDGPQQALRPTAALIFALTVHELATNAAKYGALSSGDGRVAISWRRDDRQSGLFRFSWIENGGPPVQAPRRTGFGSRFIQHSFKYELDGTTRLHYDPAGFRCLIEVELEKLQSKESRYLAAETVSDAVRLAGGFGRAERQPGQRL